jgi:protein gp37
VQGELITEAMLQELEHAETKIEHAMKNAFYDVGSELRHINKRGLYVLRFPTFEEYCQERWEMTRQRAYQLMDAAAVVDQVSTNKSLVDGLSTIVDMIPTREAHVRPLLQLDKPEDRAEVWQRVVDNANGHGITARLVEAEVERYKAALQKNWITFEEWSAGERWHGGRSTKPMNEQDDKSIEWAAWSWNPVTGCLHDCPYCYARDMANRFYPYGFQPAFIPERLDSPANTKQGVPRWKDDIGYRTVFVCSMADLFGEWVPQEWIDAVMASVGANPQWNFIFLTKNPSRLPSVVWPANAWVGTTVDRQGRVAPAESAFEQVNATVKFVSCEPLKEELTFSRLDLFDWVILGGQTKSSQCAEFQPEWKWVKSILLQADLAGCKLYWKDNLHTRPREYPER